jgi:hypothetical protein
MQRCAVPALHGSLRGWPQKNNRQAHQLLALLILRQQVLEVVAVQLQQEAGDAERELAGVAVDQVEELRHAARGQPGVLLVAVDGEGLAAARLACKAAVEGGSSGARGLF